MRHFLRVRSSNSKQYSSCRTWYTLVYIFIRYVDASLVYYIFLSFQKQFPLSVKLLVIGHWRIFTFLSVFQLSKS